MARRARLGGAATKEKWRREGVTERELGPLETVADAKTWVRILTAAVASGRIDKGDAATAIRGVEVWLKGADSLVEVDVLRLADRADEIEEEGKAKRHLRRLR